MEPVPLPGMLYVRPGPDSLVEDYHVILSRIRECSQGKPPLIVFSAPLAGVQDTLYSSLESVTQASALVHIQSPPTSSRLVPRIQVCRQTLENEGNPPVVGASWLSVVEEMDELHQSAAEALGLIPQRPTKDYIAPSFFGAWAQDMPMIKEQLDIIHQSFLAAEIAGEITKKLLHRMLLAAPLLSGELLTGFLTKNNLSVKMIHIKSILGDHSAFDDVNPSDVLRQCAQGCDVVVVVGSLIGMGRAWEEVKTYGRVDVTSCVLAKLLGVSYWEGWLPRVGGVFTVPTKMEEGAFHVDTLGVVMARDLMVSDPKPEIHVQCLDVVDSVRLCIRGTKTPEEQGTIICATSGTDPFFVGFRLNVNLTLISIQTSGYQGIVVRVLQLVEEHSLQVWRVDFSSVSLTLLLNICSRKERQSLVKCVDQLDALYATKVVHPCASVHVIGENAAQRFQGSEEAFRVFQDIHVHWMSHVGTRHMFTFVVDEGHGLRLLRYLHRTLLTTSVVEEGPYGKPWAELAGVSQALASTSNHEWSSNPDFPGFYAMQVWWAQQKSIERLIYMAEEESPLYIYHRATIEEHIKNLKSIAAIDRLFYSMKANAFDGVLCVVYESGMGFECVSIYEVRHVMHLFPDIDPQRVLFTPNFAPRREYEEAFQLGVHVTVDSLHPFQQWPQIFQKRQVLARLDPGAHLASGHHAHVLTAGTRSKFGVAGSDIEELACLADKIGCTIVGLHCHVGSGILSSKVWSNNADFLLSVQERLFPSVRYLDVGGGLGVRERSGMSALDVQAVQEALGEIHDRLPEGVQLWMEPGRYVVAESGVLLTTVTQTKHKGEGKQFLGVDVGMSGFIRPALYGSVHEIVNLSRIDTPATCTVDVVGPICESGDVLGHNRSIAEGTQEGDVLLVACVGAYGRSMSSEYNMRPAPSQKMV